MIYFTEEELDRIIKEDMPYFDLTTYLTHIGSEHGSISYISRGRGVVASSNAVSRIYKKLGADVEFSLRDGAEVEEGTLIFKAKGSASTLHMAWKCCLNILEYTMGIATAAKKFVHEGRRGNPQVSLVFTRKSFPGTKSLATSAAMAGGMLPHRLGLSETVLIFDQHIEFMGGKKGLEKRMPSILENAHEKKVIIEAHNLEDALFYASIGVDGIQIDKLPVEKLKIVVGMLRAENPGITLIATGGITAENAFEYGKTGVDVIASSSVFHAKPFDVKAKMEII